MAFEYPKGHHMASPGAKAAAPRSTRNAMGAEAPFQVLAKGGHINPREHGTEAGLGLSVLAPAIITGASALIDRFAFPETGLLRAPSQPAQDLMQTGGTYGVPFGGPGLKEPGGKYLLKEWHIRQDSKDGDFDLQFYLTQNDRGTKRIFMYNQRTKAWKSWPMPRLAVIGKNMPRHQMITRLRRNLKRHTADAVTILKLTSPGKLESTRKPGGRYVRGRKRYID